MDEVYRVTIRLTPEVYAQLGDAGRSGKPLAAIVRDALVDYLTRQPQQPTTAEDSPPLVAAMTAMTARLDTLEHHLHQLTTQVAAMTATAASGQTHPSAQSPPHVTATRQSRQPRQSQQSRQPRQSQRSRQPRQSQRSELPAWGDIPPFDTTKFVLGKLCPRGHEYYGTGQTLRRLSRHVCPACDVERTREARQARLA
jgi:hypothetical protein